MDSAHQSNLSNFSSEANLALQEIDTGLRSQRVGDQYEAVLKVKPLLQKVPFPLFANALFLRLAEVFQMNTPNQLRSHIVKTVGECESELLKVFSKDVLAQHVLKVSHSNDPVARGLTLRFLASLAPLLAENQQVRHLIAASLDCSDKFELSSAIEALPKYASQNASFCRGVVGKVGHMVMSKETSMAVRLKLIAIFRHMHSDIDTTIPVFTLCSRLIEQESENDPLKLSLVNSLTCLATKCPLIVPDQIQLLIDQIGISSEKRKICPFLIRNLTVIARSPHMWTADHVHQLITFAGSIGSDSVDLQLQCLRCINALASVWTSSISVALQGNWPQLWKILASGESASVPVKLAAAESCINLSKFVSNEQKAQLNDLLFAIFSELLGLNEHQQHLTSRFFKLLASHLNESSLSNVDSHCISERQRQKLIESILKLIERSHENGNTELFSKAVQCLACIAGSHPELYSLINRWIQNCSFKHHFMLANFVYMPGCLDSVKDSVGWETDVSWNIYRLARTALRNGHTASLAKTIFAKLSKCVVQSNMRHWLTGLERYCDAQNALTSQKGRMITVNSLNQALIFYQTASTCFEAISGKEKWFAARFTHCCWLTAFAVRSVLNSVNSAPFRPSPAWAILAQNQQAINASFLQQMYSCAEKFLEATQAWLELYRSCFDADTQTLYALELRQRLCAVCARALCFLAGNSSQAPINHALVPEYLLCVQNRDLRALICWATSEIAKIEQLDDTRQALTRQNVDFCLKILSVLATEPICVPRYFFQRLQLTDIKLQLSQQCETKTLSVPVNQLLPLKIEGILETKTVGVFSRRNLLRSVHRVILSVQFISDDDGCQQFPKMTEQVEPINGYFEAQFLLSCSKNGTICVEAFLVDKETKKHWNTNTVERLKITALGSVA